jgi:hypothetical protein
MIFSTYLSKRIVITVFILLSILWYADIFLVPTFFCTIFIFFIFRKKKRKFLEENSEMFSFLDGKVLNSSVVIEDSFFGKNLQKLELSHSFFSDFGIWSTFDGEIVEKEIYYYSRFSKRIKIKVLTRTKALIGLEFLSLRWNISPQMILERGDIIKNGANLGFIPFGGTVLLYLPKDIEIIAKKGDQVVTGKTELCSFK